MAERYLIDTSIIIDFSEDKLSPAAKSFVAKIIDTDPYFLIVNKIELLGFSVVRDNINELIEAATIIGLSDAITNKTIDIRRAKRVKLPDAIIAATCIDQSLTLVTRNLTDFQNVKGLKIVDPSLK